MGLNSYFFEVITHIENNQEVPYFVESKLNDLVNLLDDNDLAEFFVAVLSSHKAEHVFRYLHRRQIFNYIKCFDTIANLSRVPQRKGRAKNAWEHTMNVVAATPFDNIDLRWVALLHDVGKYQSFMQDDNFHYHANYSYDFARNFVKIYDVTHAEKICTIVKNHMFPADYQRNPNWTDEAVKNFSARCNGYALETIEFAIYDKRAENDVDEYIKPLKELYGRCKNLG